MTTSMSKVREARRNAPCFRGQSLIREIRVLRVNGREGKCGQAEGQNEFLHRNTPFSPVGGVGAVRRAGSRRERG